MPSCCIVIPVYRPFTEAEMGVLRHNLTMLSAYPAALIGGPGQRGLLDALAVQLAGETGAEIGVELFADDDFRGIDGYNRLLTGAAFFQRFAAFSHVLICQHDALILRDTLAEWLTPDYGFVGAPMFRGYHAPERPLRFLSSLNGGLSLRHVPAALDVLREMIPVRRSRLMRAAGRLGLIRAANTVLAGATRRRIVLRRAGLNEDVFWTEVVPAVFPGFRVPTPETAARFAFETCPADLFALTGDLPFGCHAFQRYDPGFWAAHAPAEVAPVLAACAADAGGEAKA